jgi:hypothetical protein
MPKTNQPDGKPLATHQVVTIELLTGQYPTEPTYTCVVSIGGREGTMVRSWGQPGAPFDNGDFRDLTNWIQTLINQAVLLTRGVQEAMPLR